MTTELISQVQNRDIDATLNLIEKFKPILKKYSYKLYYNDAYNDLLLDFFDLIYNIKLDNLNGISEGGIMRYILVSIHSSYIKRSLSFSKHKNSLPFSSFNESELYYIESILITNDSTLNIELSDINKILTKPELLIINMLFNYGYEVTEIAEFCNISRQAVNQTKKKALNKIKKYYFD